MSTNPPAAQVAGIDELGCGVVGIPNGKQLGDVLQMVPGPPGGPVLLPGFGPGGLGGPVTVGLALAGGVLAVTVNGVTASVGLRGSLAVDLAGVPLGYWLPLT